MSGLASKGKGIANRPDSPLLKARSYAQIPRNVFLAGAARREGAALARNNGTQNAEAIGTRLALSRRAIRGVRACTRERNDKHHPIHSRAELRLRACVVPESTNTRTHGDYIGLSRSRQRHVALSLNKSGN